MTIEVEAVYENGMLKLDAPLPLAEHQRVKIVVEKTESVVEKYSGVVPWHGDPAILDRMAIEPEFGISESP